MRPPRPSTDDELNIIKPGHNYGWPDVHGYCDLPAEITFCDANDVREPQIAWTPTIAVSDIEHYDHDAIPDLKGTILLVTLKEKDMRVIRFEEDGHTVSETETYFDEFWNRLRAICVSPDGAIYLSNSRANWGNSTSFDHQIVKIYNPDAQGYNDVYFENEIQIFPNPFRDDLRIQAPSDQSVDTIELHTAQGTFLAAGSAAQIQDALNSEQIRSGIYFLTTRSDHGTFSTSVVKAGY